MKDIFKKLAEDIYKDRQEKADRATREGERLFVKLLSNDKAAPGQDGINTVLACEAEGLEHTILNYLSEWIEEQREPQSKTDLFPAEAAKAYLDAMSVGVYPPVVVLKWIERALKKYIGDNKRGPGRLDDLLGFTTSGRSGGPVGKDRLCRRNAMICTDMFYLKKVFNMSSAAAGNKLVWKYPFVPAPATFGNIFRIDADGVVKKLNERFGPHCGLRPFEYLNDRERKIFISSFPAEVRDDLSKAYYLVQKNNKKNHT